MIRNDSEEFRKAVNEVAKQLVSTEHRQGMSFVSVPLTYPSGAGVVVRVADAYPDFFVSDYGVGFEEAEMMGGSTIFSRQAPNIAKNSGVGYDQRAFFVMKASRDQLPGAIVAVANCSLEAVTMTAFKLAEKKHAEDAEFLYNKLVSVFDKSAVARDVPILGHSNTEWHVSTFVKRSGRSAIFEPVSKHHTSVFAAATKFHDISLNKNAPRLVSVVKSKADFDTYLGILSQSSSVIETGASSDVFRRIAEAA